MPRFLQKRRRKWYAVLEIPRDLRERFGKPRFLQSLKTESLSEAERICLPVIHEWKELIESVRNGAPPTDAILAMRQSRLMLEQQGVSKHEIDMFHSELATETDILAEAHLVVHGGWIVLSEHIQDFVQSLSNEPKTIDMKRRDVERFSKKFKYAHDITIAAVAEWVQEDLIEKDQLSPATCKRIISACSGYWTYLQRKKGLDIPPPFERVVPRQGSKADRAKAIRRKHFIEGDFRSLITAAAEDAPLVDLIILGAYTGARIEEICSLKITNVHSNQLHIEDAKTDAGWREIPIHSKIVSLVGRLKGESMDGYLLSGLTFNKYGDRSNAIGKRFGRLKTACGYDRNYVFHSFRKSVATQLENAGIPENVTARLLGHELNTMSYGLYSGGLSYGVLRDAVEHISWSASAV
jgi:integrase